MDAYGMEEDPRERAMAMAAALRGQADPDEQEQRRLAQQRAFGNLGLLTGDSVLGRFGASQIQQAQQAQPLGLRGATLAQGAERLRMQSEAEKRKAEQGSESLALKKSLGTARLGLDRERLARDKMAAEEAKGNKAADTETGLRKEFNALPEVKEFSGIASAFSNLRAASKDMSGPGGIATIFNFMKMLDPGVAVMEGDVQLIRNSGGKAAAFANLYDQAIKGNPLSEEVRRDLVRQATGIYNTRKKQLDALQQQYTGIATQAGASPERVIVQRAPEVSSEEPAAGARAAPRIVSVKGLKPGQLVQSLQEGETVRIPMGGGRYQAVKRKGGKLVKVKE